MSQSTSRGAIYSDWRPRSLVLEATSGQLMTLTSTFTTATSVTNDLMQGDRNPSRPWLCRRAR